MNRTQHTHTQHTTHDGDGGTFCPRPPRDVLAADLRRVGNLHLLKAADYTKQEGRGE